jgi:hypothetical protein
MFRFLSCNSSYWLCRCYLVLLWKMGLREHTQMLILPGVIKSSVSDAGFVCLLLASVKPWQPKLLAYK